MYIAPNSVIRVLKDCPLDNTYDHSIYFGSRDAQTDYFRGLTKYVFTEQTYQRVKRGYMRVGRKAEDLYDCNYIMFQNTSFGNKWFYAFITSVEYLGNEVSEIQFEIDVLQTWFFDYTLGECFIEREHAASDGIGENIVPEKLELGEYITEDFDASGVLGGKSIVVAATFDGSYNKVSGGYYGGIFSGLYFNVFENSPSGASACANFITNAEQKADGIVSVFLMPTAMVTAMGSSAKSIEFSKSKFYGVTRADGSRVKNNKLLTYPYNFLYVTNMQGSYAEFHYELFSSDSCTFNVAGDMSPYPSVVLCPTNYKGALANYDEKMVLSGYPQLSYNTDSFRMWLGANAGNIALNACSAAIGADIGSMYGDASLASAGLARATGLLATVYDKSRMPNQAKGGGGSQTMAAIGLMDFAFMHKHIRPQFATMIDDFFNMYGYATHRVKRPNRNVRPYWTYTKTVSCVAEGSVPADDMNKICRIYDAGITFWTNGANIGNYSLDNSV